eukprot:672747-Amphidinium_carterae.1
MQIFGGNPASVYISRCKVRFDPTDTLTWEQSILDPKLQIAVASFGVTSASCTALTAPLQSLTTSW